MVDAHDSQPDDATDTAQADVEDLRAQIAQLQIALQSRDVIGQAKGIIRLLTHTDDDAAFQVLVNFSQDTNRPVRDIASVISDCAATSLPLPADLGSSWRYHIDSTTPIAPAGPTPGEHQQPIHAGPADDTPPGTHAGDSFATLAAQGGEAGEHPAV